MNTQTLRMIAQRANAACRADWAPYIEAATRRAVAVAVAIYVAGVCCGAAIHALNDWLAPRFARVVLACDVCGRGAAQSDDPKPVAVATPAPVAAAAPLPHPLATMRDDLLALSAAELRRLAGVRSKRYSKATMAEMICAMA